MSIPTPSNKDGQQVLKYAFDDTSGKLRVDATISPDGSDLEIHHEDDSIAIGTATDLFTSTTIGPAVGLDVNVINPISAVISGSIEVELAAADGDNISIADQSGTNFLVVNPDGSLNITDNSGSITVDGTVSVDNFPATQTVTGTVDVGNFPASQTVDGTVSVDNFPVTQAISGTVSVSNFPAVQDVSIVSTPSENIRTNILKASDLIEAFTWSDFGTVTQRIDNIVYSSATYSPHTLTKTFSYTNVLGKYRLDSITWTST